MTLMQNICFIAKDSETVLDMLKEIHNDLMQEIRHIHLSKVDDGIKLQTSICNISIYNMEDNMFSFLHGKRYDVVVIDNCLRFDNDIINDLITPLVSASRFVNSYNNGTNGSHAMLIGWYQFMGEKGIVKYANCNRHETELQTSNTLERMCRKDFFREDVVRIGDWELPNMDDVHE